MENKLSVKRRASVTYGFGVAKIVASIPVIVIGLILIIAGFISFRDYSAVYYILEIALMLIVFGGSLLLYSGVNTCRLVGNYQKILALMQYKNREKINALQAVTAQSLTALVKDLRVMAQKGFFPMAYLDLNRSEFVLERDNRPAPELSDGDIILKEKVRPTFAPFLALPVVWVAYGILFPYDSWLDYTAALIISVTAACIFAAKLPRVHTIEEKKYIAPPQPEVAIKTGNGDLDDLLSTAMDYVKQLNEVSLAISSEKMILPTGELLNTTRQIFAFVEKQPEKIHQIRQFMNYYLPTTIKLLQSYSELSRQPLKGDNIKAAMTKIEDSMDGIVKTFNRELDNLYRDKTEDITIDIDLMLAMMRSNGFTSDFAQDFNNEKDGKNGQ